MSSSEIMEELARCTFLLEPLHPVPDGKFKRMTMEYFLSAISHLRAAAQVLQNSKGTSMDYHEMLQSHIISEADQQTVIRTSEVAISAIPDVIDASANTVTQGRQSGIVLPVQRTTATVTPTLLPDSTEQHSSRNANGREASSRGRSIEKRDYEYIMDHMSRQLYKIKNLVRAICKDDPNKLNKFAGRYVDHVEQLAKKLVHYDIGYKTIIKDGQAKVDKGFRRERFWVLTSDPNAKLPSSEPNLGGKEFNETISNNVYTHKKKRSYEPDPSSKDASSRTSDVRNRSKTPPRSYRGKSRNASPPSKYGRYEDPRTRTSRSSEVSGRQSYNETVSRRPSSSRSPQRSARSNSSNSTDRGSSHCTPINEDPPLSSGVECHSSSSGSRRGSYDSASSSHAGPKDNGRKLVSRSKSCHSNRENSSATVQNLSTSKGGNTQTDNNSIRGCSDHPEVLENVDESSRFARDGDNNIKSLLHRKDKDPAVITSDPSVNCSSTSSQNVITDDSVGKAENSSGNQEHEVSSTSPKSFGSILTEADAGTALAIYKGGIKRERISEGGQQNTGSPPFPFRSSENDDSTMEGDFTANAKDDCNAAQRILIKKPSVLSNVSDSAPIPAESSVGCDGLSVENDVVRPAEVGEDQTDLNRETATQTLAENCRLAVDRRVSSHSSASSAERRYDDGHGNDDVVIGENITPRSSDSQNQSTETSEEKLPKSAKSTVMNADHGIAVGVTGKNKSSAVASIACDLSSKTAPTGAESRALGSTARKETTDLSDSDSIEPGEIKIAGKDTKNSQLPPLMTQKKNFKKFNPQAKSFERQRPGFEQGGGRAARRITTQITSRRDRPAGPDYRNRGREAYYDSRAMHAQRPRGSRVIHEQIPAGNYVYCRSTQQYFPPQILDYNSGLGDPRLDEYYRNQWQ